MLLKARFLTKMLAEKLIVRAGYGHGKGIVNAGCGNKMDYNSSSSHNKLSNTEVLTQNN